VEAPAGISHDTSPQNGSQTPASVGRHGRMADNVGEFGRRRQERARCGHGRLVADQNGAPVHHRDP
jgi:hypothetical protein